MNSEKKTWQILLHGTRDQKISIAREGNPLYKEYLETDPDPLVALAAMVLYDDINKAKSWLMNDDATLSHHIPADLLEHNIDIPSSPSEDSVEEQHMEQLEMDKNHLIGKTQKKRMLLRRTDTPYPLNMVEYKFAMSCDDSYSELYQKFMDTINEDDIDIIENVMASVLDERQIKRIHLTFKSKLSYRAIASTMGEAADTTKKCINRSIRMFLNDDNIKLILEMHDGDSGLNLTQQSSITRLGLESRQLNALLRRGYDTIEDVLKLYQSPASDLTRIRNFGKKSQDDVRAKLVEFGFLNPNT